MIHSAAGTGACAASRSLSKREISCGLDATSSWVRPVVAYCLYSSRAGAQIGGIPDGLGLVPVVWARWESSG